MSSSNFPQAQHLSDADTYMLGLQKNLMNRNTNIEYMGNSRSNSSKKVLKPNSTNANSAMYGNLGLDSVGDRRSNTYHFGNNNSDNMNVNYWMKNDRGGSSKQAYNNGLSIYEDDDEDEEYDGIFDEDEDHLKSTGVNYNNQYIDLNRIKYGSGNGVNMKFDQINDARGDTISKPINNYSAELDDILASNFSNANSYMDFMLPDENSKQEAVLGMNPNASLDLDNSRLLGNSGFPQVKAEGLEENDLLNQAFETSNAAIKHEVRFEQNSSIDNIKKKKKTKLSHNVIEQKYRDNINEKILNFKLLVPTLQYCKEKEDRLAQTSSDGMAQENATYNPSMELVKKMDGLAPAKKLSKSIILSKTSEYIQHLENKVERLEALLKNYEQVLNSNSSDALNTGREYGNVDAMFIQAAPSAQGNSLLSQQPSIQHNPAFKKTISSSSESGSASVKSSRIENTLLQDNISHNRMPIPPQEIRGPSLYYDHIPINSISSTATSHSLSNSNNLSVSSMASLSNYDSFQNNMISSLSQGYEPVTGNRITSPLNNKVLRHPAHNNNNNQSMPFNNKISPR